MENLWKRASHRLDLRPVVILAVLYGAVRWLPFGIFGWLQNEDGLMEWSSVIFLAIAIVNSFRIARQSSLDIWSRISWGIFILMSALFIGEEVSWGERIHGFGIEAIRSINTQNETSLHNIEIFQGSGLLHAGWVALGLILGLGSSIWKQMPLLPDRRLCLYFLLPAAWYFGMEVCEQSGSCGITFEGQEIYEFLVALGLLLHTRLCFVRQASRGASKSRKEY